MLLDSFMQWLLKQWHSMTTGEVIYVSVVVLTGLAVLARTLAWLRDSHRQRRHWLVGRRQFDAVPTSSPLQDPNAAAARRAVDNIERHAQVTRRLLLPWLFFSFLLLLILPFLGEVPAVFVSLAVTALAVVLGIATKPLMENAIAGLVLSSSRLMRIGDTIEFDGYYGTVEDISATHTTLKVWDWRRYIVPNSKMLQSKLVNYSLIDKYEWAHIEFYVAYGSDLGLVERLAIEAAKSSEHFADYEEPKFWVMAAEQHSLRCWVMAWAETPSEAWGLKIDTRHALSEAFRKHGILSHRMNWFSPVGSETQ